MGKAKKRGRVGALAAASIVAAATLLYVWPYFVDDAFITFRYARNLTTGGGYGMNPGSTADGVTGPLWLVPLTLAALLGLSIPAAAKVLGALLALASGVLLVHRMAGRASHGAKEVSALLLATSSSYWVWAIGGLETALAVFLMTLLLVSCIRRGSRLAPVLSLALLPALRPELIPAAFVLAIGVRNVRRRATLGSLAVGVVGVAAFRLWLFSTPIPLSAVAKGGSLAQGTRYALIGVLATSAGLGLYLVWRALERRRAARLIALAALVHVVVVAIAGGDWMPGHRLLVPMVPAFALLAGWGAVTSRATRYIAVATIACASLYGGLILPEARSAGAVRESNGARLAGELTEGPLALLDAGYLAWASGLEVVDLGGVTDPAVARMPGNHVDRALDVAYLEARAPSTFVLHSSTEPEIRDGSIAGFRGYPTENRLIRSPWFRRSFAPVSVYPYAPGYWYVRFERRESEPSP